MVRRWPVTRFRPEMPIRPEVPATVLAAAMARAARFAVASLAGDTGFVGAGVGIGVEVGAGVACRAACDATGPLPAPVAAVVEGAAPDFKRSRRARILFTCWSMFGRTPFSRTLPGPWRK